MLRRSLLLALIAPPLAAQLPGKPHAIVEFPGILQQVEPADVDGDVDRAGATAAGGAFSWYANADGAGGFGAGVLLGTGATPMVRVGAADLDGDGDVDLFGGREGATGSIEVFLDLDGAGGFSGAQVVAATNILADLRAADLDLDGSVDLYSGEVWDQAVRAHVNTGSGDASLPPVTLGTVDGELEAVHAFDADVDGWTDVAVVDTDVVFGPQLPSGTIKVLRNDGAPPFPAFTGIPQAPIQVIPGAIHAADLTGDGAEELLVGAVGAGVAAEAFVVANSGGGAPRLPSIQSILIAQSDFVWMQAASLDGLGGLFLTNALDLVVGDA